MSDVDVAQDGLEHAHHAVEHPGDTLARNAAILIGVLAAGLALAEMQEKGAQSEYLSHHIAVSDVYAFLQARNVRATVAQQAEAVLKSLPGGSSDPAIAARIADAERLSQRMLSDPDKGEGAAQLRERANKEIEARDHELHRYHDYEWINGALQIAIVLASVSVVTRYRVLTVVSGLIGFASAVGAALVVAGLV
jgi:hypothetical protein